MLRLQLMARDSGFDAIHPSGKAIAEIKFSADALRTVRTGLVSLSYALSEHPEAFGYLVLIDPTITESRLREEWNRAQAVLKPDLLARLTVCLSVDGGIRGVPRNPPPDMQEWLLQVAESEATRAPARSGRIDFKFVVLKLLLHQWLTKREPVTTAWLARTAGCSYPTVARVLKGLGSIIVRESDRRLSLRFFPRDELARLVATAERARSTIRLVDQSGQPRSPESHLRRLERVRPAGVAIGGVLGAKHYVPGLDLAGTPRLDISVHTRDGPLVIDFVRSLDPALKPEADPLKPINVVVHAVRHADSLFSPRAGGLAWADPVECLLDLYEARLQAQAGQFLNELERAGRAMHER
jgi:hypothetical protein